MALLLLMAAQKNDAIFHDFLGSISTTSDSPLPLMANPTEEMNPSSASDLPSGERQMRNHFQGVPVYSAAPETTNNRSLTKKRSNSDSAFMPRATDRLPQLGPENLENFHLIKMLRNSVGGEHRRRSHEEEVAFAMHPPKPNSNSHTILQPQLGSRSDSVASKWERTGASTQYPSNLTQYTTYFEKERSAINVAASHLTSSRDAGAGPSIISPPAADEGSRTGMKGSGILSAIKASNVAERNTPEVLISSHRLKSGPVSADPDSSAPPRYSPGEHPMQTDAHTSVIDMLIIDKKINENTMQKINDQTLLNCACVWQADMIMALAGSNGGSWSTSFAAKSSVNPSPNQTTSIPSRENLRALQRNLSMPGNSIHNRFNQGGQIPTPIGSTALKSRRSFSQQEEANSEGNHNA
ncbi:hypothetical protein ACHQM5_002393 [Ranunculus cassubicifolius]